VEVADLYATLGLHPKESEWAHGDALINKMRHGLELLIGVEAIKWVGELVEKTTSAAVENEHLAQKLGITTEAVQQLSYAADVSGASVEQFQVAAQKLVKGLDQLKQKGTGDVGPALARLGIHMDDAAIKSGNLDDQLMRIADGFADAGPNVNKTALAMEIFGRSGTALIPFLNRGADGIRELRTEFVEMGAQIDEKTTKQFLELEEDQKKLKYTMTALRNEAVSALLPALKELAEGMVAWLRENREAVKSALTTVITGLTYAVKGLAIAFGVVSDVVGFFKEHSDLATAVIIALGTVIAAFAVDAAISWALAFWPLTLVVAAIAAVVLFVMDLWKSITTGHGVAARVFGFLKKVVTEAWETIKMVGRGIADVWDGIKNFAEKVADFFIGVAKSFRDAFEAAFNWIVEKADWVMTKVLGLPGFKQILSINSKATGGAANANSNLALGALSLFGIGPGAQSSGSSAETAAAAAGAYAPGEHGLGDMFGIRDYLKNAGDAATRQGIQLVPGASKIELNQNNTFQISSPNADPNQVGAVVDKKLKEANDKMLIDAHAAVGGNQAGQQ
jgi:hypothetical protein